MSYIIAIPVRNEDQHVESVIRGIAEIAHDILVVQDGSTDCSPLILDGLELELPGLRVIRHEKTLGYGKSLIDAFRYAIEERFDHVITIDSDEQHDPRLIQMFIDSAGEADIVSGSRYHPDSPQTGMLPPEDRRKIGREIVEQINRITGYGLTDAFCGFKCYNVDALLRLDLTEPGYGLPLQLWIQAWRAGLLVVEKPVPLRYNDCHRTFGEKLDDPETRLRYYNSIIDRELKASREMRALLNGRKNHEEQ